MKEAARARKESGKEKSSSASDVQPLNPSGASTTSIASSNPSVPGSIGGGSNSSSTNAIDGTGSKENTDGAGNSKFEVLSPDSRNYQTIFSPPFSPTLHFSLGRTQKFVVDEEQISSVIAYSLSTSESIHHPLFVSMSKHRHLFPQRNIPTSCASPVLS